MMVIYMFYLDRKFKCKSSFRILATAYQQLVGNDWESITLDSLNHEDFEQIWK